MKGLRVFSSLVLCLVVLVLFAKLLRAAPWSGGTIYIKADGSVEPSDAPILSINNIMYYLTEDIVSSEDGIVVERDNIVIDGQGHRITGPGGGEGIRLDHRSNITIKNIVLEGFYFGIYLNSSHQITIIDSDMMNNDYGIFLDTSYKNSIISNSMTNNYDVGIDLHHSYNNSIVNNSITGNPFGIYLWYSNNNSVSGNDVTDNDQVGILLQNSFNNRIAGNTFVNDGLFVWYSYSNTVEDNTVNGKPLVYLERASGVAVMDAGQVILVNCTKMRVENLNLSYASVGVELWGTTQTIISGNRITNNHLGIVLAYSRDNNIKNNVVMNNGHDSIYLWYSDKNIISGNDVTENGHFGTYLCSSHNNTIIENNFSNNYAGVVLDYSRDNDILSNVVTDNNYAGFVLDTSTNNMIVGNNMTENDYGIYLYYSSNNRIHHNNLIDNTRQAYNGSPDYGNAWDDGYPFGGNYWSNYIDVDSFRGQYQNETGSDGIWDHPYVIDEKNKDLYPLTKLYIVNMLTRSIELKPGYNLIALPVYNTSLTASKLLEMIGDSAQSVFLFNSSTQRYVPYDINLARFGINQTDFEIVPNVGYFVYVNNETEVTFQGFLKYGLKYFYIIPKYNLIGWTSGQEVNVSMLIGLGNGSIRSAFYFNSSSQKWISYDLDLQEFGIEQEDFCVEPGMGLFVFAREETIVVYKEEGES